MLKYLSLLFCCLLLLTANVDTQAQTKIGHINSAELLSLMPSAKSAESSLTTFAQQKENQLKSELEALQNEANTFVQKVNAGGVTPAQQADKQKYFQDKEMKLAQKEQQYQQEIAQKRESLLSPVLQKAQTAIENVAAENGYSFVIDTSMGSVLFADPSNDLLSKVKTKLGI